MQQSLNFYDAILSHDHPAYLGVLNLSLVSAKAGTTMTLVKLYIVTLTILPIQIFTGGLGDAALSYSLADPPCSTGMFSLNINVPHNGDREFHLKADGTLSGFSVFYMIVGGAVVVALTMWLLVWLIFRSSKRSFKAKGSPTDR